MNKGSTLQVENSKVITHYPHPFTDDFTLRINGANEGRATVAVFTASGFPVETFKDINADTDYPDIGATWPNGLYVVKVYRAGKLTTHMVVKR